MIETHARVWPVRFYAIYADYAVALLLVCLDANTSPAYVAHIPKNYVTTVLHCVSHELVSW